MTKEMMTSLIPMPTGIYICYVYAIISVFGVVSDVELSGASDVTDLTTVEVGDNFLAARAPRFQSHCFPAFLAGSYGLPVERTGVTGESENI